MRQRSMRMVVLAVLLVAVPIGLLGWLRTAWQDRLSTLQPEPIALVLPVESRQKIDTMQVSVQAVWGETPELYAPSWNGTVTSLSLAPGDTLSSGDVVVQIDGVDRVAVRTERPFWRSLHLEDDGPDVRMLQLWLAASGLYPTGQDDGAYDADLAAAVATWAASLGVRGTDGSFDPGWVVWLPTDEFSVSEVALAVGSRTPGAGSTIAVGPTPLLSVSLFDEKAQALSNSAQGMLQVGDAEVAVTEGSLQASALRELSLEMDPGVQLVSAVLRSSDPVAVLEVPATAVVSNLAGELCVFVPNSGSFEARAVTISDGQVGRVVVATGLSSGDEILVNPADVFEAATCP